MHVDEQPMPAFDVVARDGVDGGSAATSGEHPGREPRGNLDRHVPDDVTALRVHPDRRDFGARWIGDEHDAIAGAKPMHDIHPPREDGAVHRAPEMLLAWRSDGHSLIKTHGRRQRTA